MQGMLGQPQPCVCHHHLHWPWSASWRIHCTAAVHWLWTGRNTSRKCLRLVGSLGVWVDISFTSVSVMFLFCFCQFSVDPALEGDSHNSTIQWYSIWPESSSIMQQSSVKGHQNGDSSKISLYVYLILFHLCFLKKLSSNRIVHGWLEQNPWP